MSFPVNMQDTPSVDFDKLLGVLLATVAAPNSDCSQQTLHGPLLEKCLAAVHTLCNASIERVYQNPEVCDARTKVDEASIPEHMKN